MTLSHPIRLIGVGLALMPATTWTLTMASDKVEDATAVNNTLRQIFGAIGSSIVVVIVAFLAGGLVSHNSASVVAFNQTSLIMLILHVVLLLLAILFIDGKEKLDNVKIEMVKFYEYPVEELLSHPPSFKKIVNWEIIFHLYLFCLLLFVLRWQWH